MKTIILAFVILSGGLLIYGTMNMPDWGDPQSPANRYVSPRYIEEALGKTETPNIVSAILGDYRSFDTLGEVTVIFTAAIACALILRKRSDGRKEKD